MTLYWGDGTCKRWWNHKWRVVEITHSNSKSGVYLGLIVCRKCGARRTGAMV